MHVLSERCTLVLLAFAPKSVIFSVLCMTRNAVVKFVCFQMNKASGRSHGEAMSRPIGGPSVHFSGERV